MKKMAHNFFKHSIFYFKTVFFLFFSFFFLKKNFQHSLVGNPATRGQSFRHHLIGWNTSFDRSVFKYSSAERLGWALSNLLHFILNAWYLLYLLNYVKMDRSLDELIKENPKKFSLNKGRYQPRYVSTFVCPCTVTICFRDFMTCMSLFLDPIKILVIMLLLEPTEEVLEHRKRIIIMHKKLV